MALEYEIREVGFIGSLWGGKNSPPKNVGKTFEVRLITPETLTPTSTLLPSAIGNLPRRFLGTNSIQRLSNLSIGGKTKLYFADETDLDINLLNRNLSKSDFYFEFGFLNGIVSNDFLTQMRVEPTFFVNRKILFRYNKNQVKEITYSKIPIQNNWTFDIQDETSITYNDIYNPSSVYSEFVILLPHQQLLNLINSFQNNRFLLDDDTTRNLSDIDSLPKTNIDSPFGLNKFNLIDLSSMIDGSINDKKNELSNNGPVNDQTDGAFIDSNNQVDFTINGEPQVFIFPAKPEFIEVFTIPTNNDEELARKRALDLFILNKSSYTITNIQQFNSELKGLMYQNTVNMYSMDSRVPPTPSQKLNMMVKRYLNEYIKNYLYEQICIIEDVDIPEREPERWSIDENGDTIISPRVSVLPKDITDKAIEDRKNLDEFDSYIDDLIDDLTLDDNNVYVFKKVSRVADYSLPILRYKTKGLFRCTGEKLSTFHTGSLTDKQQKYYLTVFNEKQYTDESYHQFDITYCHISGSGSSHIEGEVDLYPAKAMYRKYMLECFGHTNGKFPFKNSKNGDYFYAIQLDRNQFKEKLDLGNFELALCELSSSGTQSHGTSSRFFTLIDESKDSKQEIVTNEGIQEYYYVTSGSIRDGIYGEPNDDAWGIVFPKMGLIILDGVILDQSCSFNTITGSVDGQNSKRLFLSISGAATPTAYRPSGSFFARSFETYLTETYFCRADFNEFNNSTNYTYTSGSNGYLKYDYFAKEPQSFITTVGLYNKQKELLAVGKLRKPIRKNDGKVCIFEVVLRLN